MRSDDTRRRPVMNGRRQRKRPRRQFQRPPCRQRETCARHIERAGLLGGKTGRTKDQGPRNLKFLSPFECPILTSGSGRFEVRWGHAPYAALSGELIVGNVFARADAGWRFAHVASPSLLLSHQSFPCPFSPPPFSLRKHCFETLHCPEPSPTGVQEPAAICVRPAHASGQQPSTRYGRLNAGLSQNERTHSAQPGNRSPAHQVSPYAMRRARIESRRVARHRARRNRGRIDWFLGTNMAQLLRQAPSPRFKVWVVHDLVRAAGRTARGLHLRRRSQR